MDYEQKVRLEISMWAKEMLQPPGMFGKTAKALQSKVNAVIPDKVHQVVTESIKGMVQAAIAGADYTTGRHQTEGVPLETLDRRVKERLEFYKKAAAVEGAGTGAGGILLGLADFPLLLGIKMKFLFDAAAHYGFDTGRLEERLFILHLFQLAFSSDEHRHRVFRAVETWEDRGDWEVEPDWRTFQQEYRDYIDLAKMLQLVPGIGAIVGAVANYRLLEKLGETAMNGYRLRLLKQRGPAGP